jgi:hypothetical protein
MTPTNTRRLALFTGLAVLALLGVALPAGGAAREAGRRRLLPVAQGGDKAVPSAPFRTEAMLKRAAPTSQWYSTLIFNPKPEAIFVQPITVKATPAGLEFALPSKEAVTSVRQDVEIRYPHRDPLLISPVAFEPGTAKLAAPTTGRSTSRWRAAPTTCSPRWRAATPMRRSRHPGRPARAPAGAPASACTPADARVLALKVGNKTYALFGPTGVKWESGVAHRVDRALPAGKGYLSVAALPDDKAETLALFTRHAYAFIKQTRVEWRYDEAASQVETTFKATTQVMEGPDNGPLLGLYPHQWFRNASVDGKLGPASTPCAASCACWPRHSSRPPPPTTASCPTGPASPRRQAPGRAEGRDGEGPCARRAASCSVKARAPTGQGKGLQRTLKLAEVFEQQGDNASRDRLLDMLKKRAEEWLGGNSTAVMCSWTSRSAWCRSTPRSSSPSPRSTTTSSGTATGSAWPPRVALRDPAWIAPDRWGGMIELLIADIATTERGRADFPFLRNWDAYEAHTWANGVGVGEFGNNNESSSEAINAWAGLILWGEVTGNKALRDLGVYLYTNEIEAINHYWFDIHGLVFAPEYKNAEVSQVFGGMYRHDTWWIDDPRQIKGINLLPVTTAHTYMGRDPAFVKRSLATLPAETALWNRIAKKPSPPPPKDIWQDVFAKYLALADPAEALKTWERWGSVELGAIAQLHAELHAQPGGHGHARLQRQRRHAAARGLQARRRRPHLPGLQRRQGAHRGAVQRRQASHVAPGQLTKAN